MYTKFPTAISATLLAFILSGCSAGGPTNSMGHKSVDPGADFLDGRIRLDCELSCAGAWGANKQRLYEIFSAERWTLLADEVMHIGFGNDLTYFYLGRAAEGLGKPEAASNYYALGQATPYHCNSIVNNCNGIDAPTLTAQRFSALKAHMPLVVEQPAVAVIPSQKKVPSPLPAALIPASGMAANSPTPLSPSAVEKPPAAPPSITAKETLTEILEDAVQGGSISSRFCRADQWLATDLIAVRGYTILAKNSGEKASSKSGPLAMYMARIESSTKGGIPITKNWYFIFETEENQNSTHWCLSALGAQ